jgi:hypothetical protein
MLQRSDASCNATSICHGGLGPGSFTISVIMTALGVTIGISSAIFFLILLQNIGIYRLHRTAMGYYLVTVALFPVMNLFAKCIGHVDWCVWAILVIQFGGSIASATSYSRSSRFLCMQMHSLTLSRKAVCSSTSVTQRLPNRPLESSMDWHKQSPAQLAYLRH